MTFLTHGRFFGTGVGSIISIVGITEQLAPEIGLLSLGLITQLIVNRASIVCAGARDIKPASRTNMAVSRHAESTSRTQHVLHNYCLV